MQTNYKKNIGTSVRILLFQFFFLSRETEPASSGPEVVVTGFLFLIDEAHPVF